MNNHSFAALAAASALVFAAPTRAAETLPEDITFTYDGHILEVFDWDTGWWPDSSSEIRVRFGASLDGDVTSEVEAQHWVSWPEAVDFHIDGIGKDGWIMVDYGLDLLMEVGYDLGILGSGTYSVPIDSYLDGITNVVAQAEFIPLLLPGHIDRPVHFEEVYSEWTLVEAPIAITTGVTLNLELILRPTLDCEYQGQEVDVFEAATVDSEGVPVHVPWMEAWETDTPGRVTLPITYSGQISCAFILAIVPKVSICIGTCFDMPEFSIDIPIQDDTQIIEYDTIDVTYDFPVLQVDDRDIDMGSVRVGEESFVDLAIWNPGQHNMEVWGSITDPDGIFDIFPTASTIVPPGEGRELRLYFMPDTIGYKEATLYIDTDAPANNTAEITLFGTAFIDGEVPPGWSPTVVTELGETAENANCGCAIPGAGGSPLAPIAAFVLLALASLLVNRRRF